MGQLATFEQSLKKFLTISASFHQTGYQRGEIFYSGCMFCLLNCLSSYYQIESEPESGKGRPDVVLIPKTAAHKDQAMVIEYKVGQDASELPSLAEAGLRQIATKGYATRARAHDHVKKVLQICLAFSGKDVVMKHQEVML